MADSPVQGPPLTEAAHLVLYDGVCGLCSSLLQFLLTHDRRGVFAFASLQRRTGRTVVEHLGGDPTDVLPGAVLDRAYDVIARNRYRVFGRFEQCLAPRPEFRGRFVE